MKRRDYELITEALKRSKVHTWYTAEEAKWQWQHDCEEIADAFAREKPGFDRDLFLTNCGVKQ